MSAARMSAKDSIHQVRQFWEENPLWSGESQHEPGTKEYFEEHRQVVIQDCLAGNFDERFVPPSQNRTGVLDLGCGPGFWTVELGLRGCSNLIAADLTLRALELAKKRCELYGVQAEFSQQNAEKLTFADESFSHVNCQGVIHHTPNTEACVREIARVLRPGGTASISVYYRNIFLRSWPILKFSGKVLSQFGGGLKGRGRTNIFSVDDVDEIVRLYDGAENPVGKAYTKNTFVRMLEPFFRIDETFLHLFPSRALPFKIPHSIHSILDRSVGFMIYATLVKR